MSFFAINDAELDLGIEYARTRFNLALERDYLRSVADHLLMLRQTEHLEFPDALRAALDHFKLSGRGRERAKAVIGKMFNSRSNPMHKGKRPKKVRARRGLPVTIDRHGQYGFVLPNARMETNHGRRTRKGE